MILNTIENTLNRELQFGNERDKYKTKEFQMSRIIIQKD